MFGTWSVRFASVLKLIAVVGSSFFRHRKWVQLQAVALLTQEDLAVRERVVSEGDQR